MSDATLRPKRCPARPRGATNSSAVVRVTDDGTLRHEPLSSLAGRSSASAARPASAPPAVAPVWPAGVASAAPCTLAGSSRDSRLSDDGASCPA
eukprot:scaffold2685_cov101-Isochrysis_galbana.AAC.5